MPHAVEHRLTKEMKDCIDLCDECRTSCLNTVSHCLSKGGAHAEPAHIVLLLDCADICSTSAGFMGRGSEMHAEICGICADVCDRCAESCESLAAGDQMMKACAETCRRCAESCRRMAKSA